MRRRAMRRSAGPGELTAAQQRLWAVLQDERNRALPLAQLCAAAGYKTLSPWRDALKDEAFRALLTAHGIAVRRLPGPGGPPVVVPLAADPDAVWAADIIDLRRVLAAYPKHIAGSAFRLDFTVVANPALRALVKRYFRARVGYWEADSFRSYLRRLKPFFLALSARYPDLASFAPLTRAMLEPLLHRTAWTDARGRQRPISAHARWHLAVALDGMFTYLQRHGWPGAPGQRLIYAEDKPKLAQGRPRPLPPDVLAQLLAHRHRLPPYARHLVAILTVTGLRAEDALHLPEDCLEADAAGDPRLRWYNHKMKREGPPLPVTEAVAAAIRAQRALVADVPDLYGRRYLFRTPRGLYSGWSFRRELNLLAAQVPIRGADGAVHRFKPHEFRHTVGTEMINHGMGIADVMAYLDHDSPEMTLRYAQIHDETLKAKFKQVVQAGGAVGGLALAALREQLAGGDERELDWVVANLRRLSLPWGYCLHHAKAPKCPYGQNACFTNDAGPCHKLVTTPEHAPVIVATLADLRASHRHAREQGWELYATDLGDQIAGMERVLAELALPADQRPPGRGGARR